MSKPRATWVVIGGSVLGGRHVTTGAPNQDAWRSESILHRGDEYVVMAVADGHGGSRYVRSDIGSTIAAAVATDLLSSAVADGLLDGPSKRVEREAARELPKQLVSMWADRCREHLATHPFTEEERARVVESLDDDPLLSYGSTLLVGVLGPSRCLILQLGDGDSLVALADGSLVKALPPDSRLTGGETTSLCLPDAASDFRVALVEDPMPTLVLLSTDGYGVAFADPEWRQSVAKDLVAQLQGRGVEQVERSLPGWLEDSAQVGGDDVTVAIGYRVPGGPKPRRRRSRLGAVVAVGLIGVLLGAGVGWAAGVGLSGGNSAGQPPPTTTSTSIAGTTTATSAPSTTTYLGTGGGVTQGEDPSAWISGAGGTVVEFSPIDPKDPAPVFIDSIGESVPNTTTVAWGAVWTLEEGVLHSNGDPLGPDIDDEILFVGVEFENGVLWLLSQDGRWLVAFKPGSLCEMSAVRNGFDDEDDNSEARSLMCLEP